MDGRTCQLHVAGYKAASRPTGVRVAHQLVVKRVVAVQHSAPEVSQYNITEV